MSKTVTNPILRGFNPDPSICRVGEDFFVATSTFEWYPGVQIHHSRDLQHWQLVARPLNEARLLNMLGTPDSCGVWAPCLTWHDGLFYLLYTDVKRFDGNFKDTHNYLTTAPSIEASWSDPVYLNSSGFDPSLYHADDGRKWYLNMIWDHRPDRSFFQGIALDEYLPEERRLAGQPKVIFDGTELDCTEAPHLYRHRDYYYLITAEGGTGYGHAVTMARSRNLQGPYEVDPSGPIVTSKDDPHWPLQRAGHADIVELEDGRFYMVLLASRRTPDLHSPLGRESILQSVEFTHDGWFRLPGGQLPKLSVAAPEMTAYEFKPEIERDDFDAPTLNPVYQWLRTPELRECFSLTARPGHLRLTGMESPGSLYKQTLVARRQTEFDFEAETMLEFEPDNFQQMAGIICYYNATKFHYLYVSTDEELGKHLGVMSCEADRSMTTQYPLHAQRLGIPSGKPVCLKATVVGRDLVFSWALAPAKEAGEATWHPLPLKLDMQLLTDQAGVAGGEQFTGTFVGVCCHDVSGKRIHADFDYFSYQNMV